MSAPDPIADIEVNCYLPRMRSFLHWTIFAALVAPAPAQAQTRQFAWPSNLAGKSILYVGAHPDDEWGVSPLLAEACIDRDAKCHFVVASEANSYGCLLTIKLADPEKCSKIRRKEMLRSAKLFGAKAEFYGWADLFYAFNNAGLDRTLKEWADQVGGHRALVDRFEKTLREQRPQIVFTLDPRHGSTCHPSHRASALLLVEAVGRLSPSDRPQVWFEQTDNIDERSVAVEAINQRFGYSGWPETTSQTVWFDGNRNLKNGRPAYSYVQAVLQAHPSQFPKVKTGQEKADAPASQRRIPLVALDTYRVGDFCSPLGLKRPTFDILGMKERFGIK